MQLCAISTMEDYDRKTTAHSVKRLKNGHEGLSEAEQLAELLRLALFEKTPLENPLNAFMERLRNGDFNPLQHGEDPNDLPENREPLTDEEYKRRKSRVYAISKYYNGKSSAKVFEVMAEAIMNLE